MTKLEELDRTHDAKCAARRVAYVAWKGDAEAADAAEAAYSDALVAEVDAWVALQKEAKKLKENSND